MMLRGREEDDPLVSTALDTLASAPASRTPLPDPSFIWWKAQLLRRFEAEREAIAPMDVGDHVHAAAAVLGACALAAGLWDHVSFVLTLTPATGLTIAASVAILVWVVAMAAVEHFTHR